jgi:hypothetical protein
VRLLQVRQGLQTVTQGILWSGWITVPSADWLIGYLIPSEGMYYEFRRVSID